MVQEDRLDNGEEVYSKDSSFLIPRDFESEISETVFSDKDKRKKILPGFDSQLVEYAKAQLSKKGIEFSIGTPIVEATAEGVKIKKGEDQFEFIKAGTVVWAAGVRGHI